MTPHYDVLNMTAEQRRGFELAIETIHEWRQEARLRLGLPLLPLHHPSVKPIVDLEIALTNIAQKNR